MRGITIPVRLIQLSDYASKRLMQHTWNANSDMIESTTAIIMSTATPLHAMHRWFSHLFIHRVSIFICYCKNTVSFVNCKICAKFFL